MSGELAQASRQQASDDTIVSFWQKCLRLVAFPPTNSPSSRNASQKPSNIFGPRVSPKSRRKRRTVLAPPTVYEQPSSNQIGYSLNSVLASRCTPILFPDVHVKDLRVSRRLPASLHTYLIPPTNKPKYFTGTLVDFRSVYGSGGGVFFYNMLIEEIEDNMSRLQSSSTDVRTKKNACKAGADLLKQTRRELALETRGMRCWINAMSWCPVTISRTRTVPAPHTNGHLCAKHLIRRKAGWCDAERVILLGRKECDTSIEAMLSSPAVSRMKEKEGLFIKMPPKPASTPPARPGWRALPQSATTLKFVIGVDLICRINRRTHCAQRRWRERKDRQAAALTDKLGSRRQDTRHPLSINCVTAADVEYDSVRQAASPSGDAKTISISSATSSSNSSDLSTSSPEEEDDDDNNAESQHCSKLERARETLRIWNAVLERGRKQVVSRSGFLMETSGSRQSENKHSP